MSRYTLSIHIMSDNLDLLENLLVTLEPVSGEITEIDRVKFIRRENGNSEPVIQEPSTLQRNLFLDKWALR